MLEKNIKVAGMSCQHCVKAIEMELKELELLSYTVEIGNVKLKYNEDVVSNDKIENAIKEAGFKIIG